MTEKIKRSVGAGEDGAILINTMLGNYTPKTEIHECFHCDFNGPHIVSLYLADIDKAQKQYKCTKCNRTWVFTDDND